MLLCNISYSLGTCDGPPWDPCEIAQQEDISENKHNAESFIINLPDKIASIHRMPLTIDKFEQMGLLGNDDQSKALGASIEFLIWQAGFIPGNFVANANSPYTWQNFYPNTERATFKYLIPPFDYQKGWGYCQALKYRPSVDESKKAEKLLQRLDNLIDALTSPLPDFDGTNESYHSLADKYHRYYDSILAQLDTFDYDREMNEANMQFNAYSQKQASTLDFTQTHWLNQPCHEGDTGGRLTQQ